MKSVLFLSILIISCVKPKSNNPAPQNPDANANASPGQNPAGAPAPIDDRTAALQFRNIFYSYAQAKYSQEDVQKLVYLPTDDLLGTVGRGADPVERMKTLSEDSSRFQPSQLFEHGKSVAMEAVADVDAIYKKTGPVTIVVIPGIFSEFIESYNFYELLHESKSSLSLRYAKALEAADTSLKQDPAFDFGSFKEEPMALDTVIKAGSYDDASGNPLVNVVVLRSEALSGESVGSLEENAEVYLRRIDKFFQLTGKPDNLYLMGYSRGAPVALQMITMLGGKNFNWSGQLRGMISLGGVLYGAALADAAFTDGDPLHAIAARIKELSEELEIPADDASTASSLAAAVRNSGRWVAAAAEVSALAYQLPKDPGLGQENISPDWLHLEANVKMLKAIAFEKFNLSDYGISNYFLNIKKFKWIINRALVGVETLTTNSRIAWWKAHTIPTNIKYYALSGVMGDLSIKDKPVWDMLGNSIAFNAKAIDYLALRMNYYDNYRVSKSQLSDSQSSVDRSRFVLEINKVLNPAQADFSCNYLGVMGVDHWGMAFPFATVTKNREQSPFPRSFMIQSIANFVARQQ